MSEALLVLLFAAGVSRFLWHEEYTEFGDEGRSQAASLSKLLSVVTGMPIVFSFILVLEES